MLLDKYQHRHALPLDCGQIEILEILLAIVFSAIEQ